MANYIWWSNPLFDRAQQDIDFLSPKSRLNASDLNRIEGNIGWLNDRWSIPSIEDFTWDEIENHFPNWNALDSQEMIFGITTRQWQRGEKLRLHEINRVVQNAQKIRAAFGLQSDSFSTLLFWMDLNTIERLSYDAWRIFIGWPDWDCIECRFDIWDDFEAMELTWDDLSRLSCENIFTWDTLEETFGTWDDFDAADLTWSQLECNKEI